jgi:hypothetical protein
MDKYGRSGEPSPQAKEGGRHSIFGALNGLIWVPPGVDLTEPADPDWDKSMRQMPLFLLDAKRRFGGTHPQIEALVPETAQRRSGNQLHYSAAVTVLAGTLAPAP